MDSELALFKGSWQKVLIKALLLLLILFVVYSLIKKIKWKPTKSEEVINDYIENELQNTTPVDNSTPTDPDTISDAESELIANNLQVYMAGTGTNETSMFNALECLNGASLNKVYSSFGAREYEGTMMDIYGWFASEMSNWFALSYYSDCVPECDSFVNDCFELNYMRAIWSKSSIPVSF